MSVQGQLNQVQNYPSWLAKFLQTYQSLNVDNIHLLNDIYAPQVVFQDPMHKIVGLDNLQHYFHTLYKNLKQCDFTIERVVCDENEASVFWQMRYIHPKLNSGKQIVVQGTSLLIGEHDQVISHRDYLDLGEMLYEQVPLLGSVIKWLKAKAVTNV